MNVTVVIPCHNAAAWVSKALDSVLGQRGGSPRVIVVDDGSTDDSLEVLNGYAERIELIRNPTPRGSNPSRQRGLERVDTEWVQFLDADDWLDSAKIARQLEETSPDRDMVYGPLTEVFFENTEEVRRVFHEPSPPMDAAVHWIRWQLAQTGTMLWRTESLRRIGGWNPEQPFCQDNELCLRALMHGLSVHYCPYPGTYYRVWSDFTLSRKDPSRIIHERTRLTCLFMKHLESNGLIQPEHRQAAGRASFEMARTLAAHDLESAGQYASRQQREGYWSVTGPAASKAYRTAYRLAGFPQAERLARWSRQRKSHHD